MYHMMYMCCDSEVDARRLPYPPCMWSSRPLSRYLEKGLRGFCCGTSQCLCHLGISAKALLVEKQLQSIPIIGQRKQYNHIRVPMTRHN